MTTRSTYARLKAAVSSRPFRTGSIATPASLTTRDVSGGGHALLFDAGTLKMESQQKSLLGVHKFRKQDIAVASIAKVEFEWEEDDLQVTIQRQRQGSYEMVLKPAEAIKMRALFLQNGVPKEIVGAIPKKH